MNANLSQDQFKDYTGHYNKGWKHSETAKSPDLDRNPNHTDPAAYRAWEDGYMDSAAGREKYALRGHRFNGDHIEGY